MNIRQTSARLRLLGPLAAMALMSNVLADVPGRVPVRGTVPMPGTQQQELANLTFPAPYNVFEFIVTCAACHGGAVDQQVGHFGNWSGTSMASAARDPVYRASQIIVNAQLAAQTGKDGGGNACMRCHAPNGWYSGRFDPNLGGAGDGSTMLHSILASTDDEGVACEACHRTMGAVTFKRPDLDPMDAVWNLLADIDDWPHSGMPFVDQAGDPTIAEGNPYGNGSLQFAEGMTYIGRYPGTADIYWNDLPLILDPLGAGGFSFGGPFTGQNYGIYPPGWIDPLGNPVGGMPATGPDGVSLLVQLDIPIGPPLNPNGTPNYTAQSVSPEHSTVKYPNLSPAKGFIQTSEFCGGCHEETIAVMNHGKPQQRTYTEWKYSAFGREGAAQRTCQDCHMPRLSHEYSDAIAGSYNSDPLGEPGGWPYSKPRVNTAVHKFAGANRDLPAMMKELYPEVDFEVIGGAVEGGGNGQGTGHDTRIFPGMLSNRDPMWERNQRNTEITLADGVDVQIINPPAFDAITGKWTVQVKVFNNAGHKVPSGYPDGRRMWLNLAVTDGAGVTVYESGHYDEASAQLFTDASKSGLNPALTPLIDSSANAVMIYQRITGTPTTFDTDGNPTVFQPSLDPLNEYILFDNRIPPAGFTYADYRLAGAKFWNYDPATFAPVEDVGRYADGQNFDLVTYTFTAPGTAVLSVRAQLYWQTLPREYMEYLRATDTSTVRPEGPPRPWAVNYPIAPNYLSEEYGLADVSDELVLAGFISQPLRDNWGGIAYAAWYRAGKGAPYVVAADDTAMPAVPTAPAIIAETIPYWDPEINAVDPFAVKLTVTPVPDADGYLVWMKYGPGLTTSWDKMAILLDDGNPATPISMINVAMNVSKTYEFKVQAFNGKGYGADSSVIQFTTPKDLPLPADQLRVYNTTATSISLSWMDTADNEDGFVIYRQDVPPVADYYIVAVIPSQTAGGFGGNNWTDTGLLPGQCFNYQVAAYNGSGVSIMNINGPVQGCTAGAPSGPTTLTATPFGGFQVDLAWSGALGAIEGYRIERSVDGTLTWALLALVPDPAAAAYSDITATPGQTFWYRVFAVNAAGDSPASPVASATTPLAPAPASGLTAVPSDPGVAPLTVTLAWTDNSNDEVGFIIERGLGGGGGVNYAEIARVAANVTTFIDDTAAPQQTYSYRVIAYHTLGQSAPSPRAIVVTPAQAPEAPSGLRVTTVTRSSITIAWTDNSQNETGFTVERSINNATWTVVASTRMNVSSYKDSKLSRNTTYWYRVCAFNADGPSAYSAPTWATTPSR